MAEKEDVAKSTVNFEIAFPLAPKEREVKQTAFNELLSLLAGDKERIKVDLKPDKENLRLFLNSDEFGFGIFFKERVSVSVSVSNPKKNIERVNEIGNKILSFINIVLGKGAAGSRIMTTITTIDKEKESINLSKKIIGDTRLAKINNKVKLQLNPSGITLEYKLKDRDFLIGSFSNRTLEMFTTHNSYKDVIPFDVLLSEYNELESSKKVIESLSSIEL